MQQSMSAAADERGTVDLTPMLDVVFILLIFFVVVAVFVDEVGLDIDRPAFRAPDIPVVETILVKVAADSTISIDNRSVDPRVLQANIRSLASSLPNAVVAIDADPRSANRALVQVMDAARLAGIYDVSLAQR